MRLPIMKVCAWDLDLLMEDRSCCWYQIHKTSMLGCLRIGLRRYSFNKEPNISPVIE